MKIDVYSNMYNEEPILPYWLRHYETFVDRIFVWDGGSTDKTLEMLKKHPKVTLLPRDIKRGHDDEYYVKSLYPQYRTYSRGYADWVIVADADEFIYHPHIRKVLEKAKKDGIQMIQCEGYAMVSKKFPNGNGQIYDEIKTGYPNKTASKWTIYSPDISVGFFVGRHGRPWGYFGCNKSRDCKIKLLHYHFIGMEYLKARTLKNIEGVKLFQPDFPITLNTPNLCPNGDIANMLKWLDKHATKAPLVPGLVTNT